MKTQRGFTLIEMVAVIIILAIMAATAMPKFTSLSGEARLAALNGITGALSSTVALAKSKWLAADSANQVTVDMGGTFVSVISSPSLYQGSPTGNAAGIWAALDGPVGFTSGTIGTAVSFWPTGVTTSSNCSVAYQSGIVTMAAAASAPGACL